MHAHRIGKSAPHLPAWASTRMWLLLGGLVLVLVSCGADGEPDGVSTVPPQTVEVAQPISVTPPAPSPTAPATEPSENPDAQNATFCAAIETAMALPNGERPMDEVFGEATGLAPSELIETMQVLSQSDAEVPDQAGLDAAQKLFAWVNANCSGRTTSIRYVAPAAVPDGFIGCGDTASALMPIDRLDVAMVVYGSDSDDPFAGPVIAVMTGIAFGPGDGPATKTTVNGSPAVAGPAGVFQAVASSELAHVVTWQMDGTDLTVFGRGYGADEIPVLVDLAESVEIVDGIARLGTTELRVLYEGSADPLIATNPMFPFDADYSLHLRRADEVGSVGIHGFAMTPETFAATQAFFVETTPASFAGRTGFVGASWSSADGPFVAAWQEPDGLVVWVVGLGVDRQTTIAVAESSIELNGEAWTDVSRTDVSCLDQPDAPEPIGTPEPGEPLAGVVGWAGASINPSGSFGYLAAGAMDIPSCGESAAEGMVVVDLRTSTAASVAAANTGYRAGGLVRALAFRDDATALALLSCAEAASEGMRPIAGWLQLISFDDSGAIDSVGDRIELEAAPVGMDNAAWLSPSRVEFSSSWLQDPSDWDTLTTGQVTVELTDGAVSFETGVDDQSPVVSPDGYRYRVIDDPNGSPGCEGFGTAVTLGLETDAGLVPAIRDETVVFSQVTDMRFGPDDLVTWLSSCEGYVTTHIGRTGPGGAILDAHWINWVSGADVRIATSHISEDLQVVGLGSEWIAPDGPSIPVVARWDVRTDPEFVNSGERRPEIAEEPLVKAMAGSGDWFSGTTLSSEPACGSETLYREIEDGYKRLFAASEEIAPIIDVDVSEPSRYSWDEEDSPDRWRLVAFTTQCPGEVTSSVFVAVDSVPSSWPMNLAATELDGVEVLSITGDVFEAELEVRHSDGMTETVRVSTY